MQITIDAKQTIAYLNNVKAKFANTGALLDHIGKAGIEIVKKLLQPIRRTGALEESFTATVGSDNVVIGSDRPEAEYIATGFRKAPSVQALQDWMRNKSEFSGMDSEEQIRVAYAIQKSIDRGDAPGPNSTLRALEPVGERKYDYIKLATDQLSKKVAEEVGKYLDAN